jgi:hypothetical protein
MHKLWSRCGRIVRPTGMSGWGAAGPRRPRVAQVQTSGLRSRWPVTVGLLATKALAGFSIRVPSRPPH